MVETLAKPRFACTARRYFAVGLGALASVLAASSVRAAEYYVATNGSNQALGSRSAPFKTIRRAIQLAQPGDTVLIRGGSYSGWDNQINPVRSGRADAWITFKAAPGELPILTPPEGIDGGSAFEPLDGPVAYIRVEGLVALNWPSSGFSNGWTHPSSNIEIRHCVADRNGVNGITFYKASGLLFEYNIAAHNGNLAPSWSSGVNLYTVTGSASANIVRGNVSFENIDICGAQNSCNAARSTDGNGFILDQESTGALFVNNIAFRNGGSCVRISNSSGAQIVNNTCYRNALDTGYAFLQTEIFFSDNRSRTGAVVRNNIAAPGSGISAINAAGAAVVQNNLWVGSNGATPFFNAPSAANPDFTLSMAAGDAVDRASTEGAPASDIGFDPRCLKEQGGQAVPFWQHAIDYEYIASIGGVAACFHPGKRPQAAAPDLGAYERGNASGCKTAVECDDGKRCTLDVCGGIGHCNHSSIAECCETASDCDDRNPCTTEACDMGTGKCNHVALSGCCESSSDCIDDDPCTDNGCNLATHQCVANRIARCCTTSDQCVGESACLKGSCDPARRVCSNLPVSGCCKSAVDCDDKNPCTSDACTVETGSCSNTRLSECCQQDADCADTDDCTLDRCDTANRRCMRSSVCGGFGGARGGSSSIGAPPIGTGGTDPIGGSQDGESAQSGCACSLPRRGPREFAYAAGILMLALFLGRRRVRPNTTGQCRSPSNLRLKL